MTDTANFALPPGYTVQVDDINPQAWHTVLDRFADANIYQSWAYGSQRSGSNRISHWRLLRHGAVVAAAQLKIVKLPLLKLGVAYVRWGPLWRLRGEPAKAEVLALALKSIRCEYAVRRGLTVRLLPYVLDAEDDALCGLADTKEGSKTVWESAQFVRLNSPPAQRTLLMSLQPSLSELRAGLDQKWRNGLNRAERNHLVVEEGCSDALFERFAQMHAEMHQRKGFVATSNVTEFRRLQRDLPPRHQMRVFLASISTSTSTSTSPAAAEQTGAAGVVCSHLGDFGVFLHGATTDAGMRTQASYLLQWRVLTWLKAQGATSYNLHGINPKTNPGTYHFKVGLCGRNGRDRHYLGTCECKGTAGSQAMVGVATSVRRLYRSSSAAAQRVTSQLPRLLPGMAPEQRP